MTISEKQWEEIVEALDHWHKNHPRPEEPTIIIGSHSYTPEDIFLAAKYRSVFGTKFAQFLVDSEIKHKKSIWELVNKSKQRE